MKIFSFILIFSVTTTWSQFAPQANMPGTTAIHKDSSVLKSWASSVVEFNRGPEDIAIGATLASFGDSTMALGIAEGNNTDVVSLGDGGSITLHFSLGIKNEPGFDFAVFENGFDHTFLEFAHIEVSSDGTTFIRIPSESQVQTSSQTNGFGSTSTEEIHNLAGKYIAGYGTPFDLEDITDSTGINLDSVYFVRVVDVVGSINGTFGTQDALGSYINDPYPTPFESSGFDLDAIGVIHAVDPAASTPETHSDFKVYPNPASDHVIIEVEGEKEITLYSSSGALLFSSNLKKKAVIDISAYKAGVYFLRIGDRSSKLMIK